MHSKIFQVSKKPIKDYADEDKYLEWFVPAVADYVDRLYDTDYIEANYEWFNRSGIEYNAEEHSFIIRDKVKVLSVFYDEFMQHLKELVNLTPEEFCVPVGKASYDVYWLNSSWSDEYGIYVDEGEEFPDMSTFNDFIRFADTDTKYYLGSVIDYHF